MYKRDPSTVNVFNPVNEHRIHLLRNHLTSEDSFDECVGRALLASVVFGLAVLLPDDEGFSRYPEFVKCASVARSSVFPNLDPVRRVLSPVVKPMD
jgi:hypothetical protein